MDFCSGILARLAIQFSEFRGSEFLDSQKGFAKVVAIAEATFDGYRFQGTPGFNDESFGAFDAHASDLLGDSFWGKLVEAAFETSAVEAHRESYVLHRQGAVTVFGDKPQGVGDEGVFRRKRIGGLPRDQFLGFN